MIISNQRNNWFFSSNDDIVQTIFSLLYSLYFLSLILPKYSYLKIIISENKYRNYNSSFKIWISIYTIIMSVLFIYHYAKYTCCVRATWTNSKDRDQLFNQNFFFYPDIQYWRELANEELEEALSYKWNTNKAKNVIVFVGDGMSPDTITASRIYRAGESSRLAWENFPHIGILKVFIPVNLLKTITKKR